jgi:cell wall-associated NlpC family hydrolase
MLGLGRSYPYHSCLRADNTPRMPPQQWKMYRGYKGWGVMRRLTMALCVLLVALGMSLPVPLVALAKDSENSGQRDSAAYFQYAATEGGSAAADSQYAATEGESAALSQYAEDSPPKPPPEPPPEPSEATAPEPPPEPPKALPEHSRAGDTNPGHSGRSVSQGSVALGPVVPQEDFPAYSQVVDNSSPQRFAAPGWDTGASDPHDHGKDYRVAKPPERGEERGESARFKVKIPATDVYSVYAWWPAEEANNPAARFAVKTTSGVERTRVDQRKDGGLWVKVGEYEMEGGDRHAVRISPASRKEGRVVADAVAVVRGIMADPPSEGYEPSEGREGTTSGGPTRAPGTPSIARSQGERLVSVARSHIGTRYVHSPPSSRCEAHRSEDCSCLTMLVFGEAEDMLLADDPISQWGEGRRVAEPDLRPGDLVFFKEKGRAEPITHVGIYSGNGNLVHASRYFGRVVESKMSHMRGYYGAKRL